MRIEYDDWLAAQGYNANTCSTQASHVRQVEKYYGELEPLIKDREYDRLVDEFTYSLDDERHGRPNPTKVEFSGRTYTRLQSLKGAIKRYARFLEEGFELEREGLQSWEPEDEGKGRIEKQRFALERDMQTALRAKISDLGTGLSVADEGLERSVDSGFIDILCVDEKGRAVVVELKAGKTDARVIGQISGYMGDMMAEGEFDEVRGIIVASDFDKRTLAAARAVPDLQLIKYEIAFNFEPLS